MVTVEVVFNHFPGLAHDLPNRVDQFANALATDAQARAIVNTVRVDTSAMKNGWRVTRLGNGMYMVWNEQFYAVYHEYGTHKLTATPMLEPAIFEAGQNSALLAAGFWKVT